MALRRSFRVKAGVSLIGIAILMNFIYVAIGHRVIRTAYESDAPALRPFMSHRATTPIQNYFKAADEDVLIVTIGLAFGIFAVLSSANPMGVVLSLMSLMGGSLLVFVIFDSSPSLISALHFDLIPYFELRSDNIPDEELGFIERPLRHSANPNWRGNRYSPSYGIDVPAVTRVWDTDENGFRNRRGVSQADVVVLGSSFPPYGRDLQDTYASKLEKYLDGYTVSNLGMGGYGPVEFLKVLERFGVKKKPRYAILAFQTGDLAAFLDQYVSGKEPPSVTFRKKAFGGFWTRWWLAFRETGGLLKTGLAAGFERLVESAAIDRPEIHPDVAVLNLPGHRIVRTVFLDGHVAVPADELLHSGTWQVFEKILRDFKRISEENNIVPMLAYIPFASEVYSEYSTAGSGRNWLAIRESQVATRNNDEEAARKLAGRVGIDLVSFLPAFREAARHGDFVYYLLDSHWNSEGSDIAARVTAAALRAEIPADSRPAERLESKMADRARSKDAERQAALGTPKI